MYLGDRLAVNSSRTRQLQLLQLPGLIYALKIICNIYYNVIYYDSHVKSSMLTTLLSLSYVEVR